jgi:hypothetical protein
MCDVIHGHAMGMDRIKVVGVEVLGKEGDNTSAKSKASIAR